MLIFALKLFLSPLLIAIATLISRRWGPAVSGWFLGFPFVSAPVSLVIALQSGPVPAGQAAIGSLVGQTAMCIYCALYILLARRLAWWQSILLALGVFSGLVVLGKTFPLPLPAAFFLLEAAIALLLRLIPQEKISHAGKGQPWWDLPARMLTAGLFVFAVATAAPALGPSLSGMLTALPIFTTVMAVFTHTQQGGRAAGQLMRGSILGSFGIAAFYLVVGWLLPLTGSLWVYMLAAAVTLLTNGISLRLTLQKKPPAAQVAE